MDVAGLSCAIPAIARLVEKQGQSATWLATGFIF
jgi:hypothetical protein